MHLPFLPAALTTKKPPPKWDPFTPVFSRLSQSATTHPVQTLVIVALLASTTYIQMLEHSLFEHGASLFGKSSRRADLLDGSVKVSVSEYSDWLWAENVAAAEDVVGTKHLALISLSFPPTALETSAPVLPVFPAATELVSEDPLTKVYAVPIEDVSDFINVFNAVPASLADGGEQRQWLLQTGSAQRSGNLIARAKEAIKDLWNIIKVSRNLASGWRQFLTASRTPRASMLPS